MESMDWNTLNSRHPGIGPFRAVLAPLLRTAEDFGALTALLDEAAATRRVSIGDLGQTLPGLPVLIGAKTLAESCSFMRELIKDGQYLGSITAGFWTEAVAKIAAALPAALEGRLAWLARLNRYAAVIPEGAGWIKTARDAERTLDALAMMMKKSYGYSDRDSDLKRFLPKIFAWAAPLVRSAEDFGKLCAAVPALLDSLPETSEPSPIGTLHDYDGSAIEANAARAADLDRFLAACGIG